MIKRFRTLLEVKCYELTGKQIVELKKEQIESNRFHSEVLPEYCVRSDNGKIADCDYYLQFITEDAISEDEEKFLLFDASTIDEFLKEEISGCGLDTILEDVDLRPYFNELRKIDISHRRLEPSQYLIIEISYTGGNSYFYSDDWDAEYSIEGVLKY